MTSSGAGISLNRVDPPGDYFTLITLRVLEEEPRPAELVEWYRVHLNQLVLVNRLEGTADFAFSAAAPTEAAIRETVEGLASSEHDLDLTGRTPAVSGQLETPYGPESRIVSQGYDLGDGRWLSVLTGTLNWVTVLSS